MKPEFTLTPASWTQLAASADLVVTWDAAAVAGFESLGVLIGTSRGDSDIASAISVDPTDSLTVPFAELPGAGLIHITTFLDCGATAYTYDRMVRTSTWPPHTKEFAELADRFAIEQALGAVETADVVAVVGTGWDGLLHREVGASVADVTTSGNPAAPTIWGRWEIIYGSPAVAFFDDSATVTDGWVQITIMIERGASEALAQTVLSLYRIALKDFEITSNQAFVFFVEAQTTTIREDSLAPWTVVILPVPFRGL
jgi:hypothetical protein